MSSTYTFDDHILPSGILRLVLVNDVGSDTVAVTGSRILSLATVTEEVEENGIGGVLRVPDFEVEIDDPDGVLKDTIFDRTSVTACDARVVLEVSGTEEGVMYGDVDLTTIEYISYYDNETDTERHSCKFIIFSLIKRLDSVTLDTLRTAVDAFAVSKELHTALESVSWTFSSTVTNEALASSSASWTTPAYGGVHDGLTAQLTLVNNTEYSDYLQAVNFSGLDVPVGTTVRGFAFTIHYKTGAIISESGIAFHSVKLVKGGVISGSDFAPVGNIDHPNTFGTTVVGGTNELGGLTFTPAEANANDTGIAFALKRTSNKVAFNVFAVVDYIEVTAYYESGALDDRFVVKELEIIQALQESISTNTDNVTHSVSQNFTHVDDTNPDSIETYDNLYHIWRFSGVFGDAFDRLWGPGFPGTFFQLRSAVDVLKAICGMRVAYPILVYAPGTGKVNFKIKQRGAGTVFANTDLGILISSSLQSFIGYDAFKVNFLGSALQQYSPDTITEDEFNLVAQKFDFPSYFGMSQAEIFYTPELYVDISHYMWVPDGTLADTVSNVNLLSDGADDYTTFASFLLAKFNQFWGENQMYTRTYEGTGIGGVNPVELLDQVTIDGTDFTIVSIQRDLIANEMTLKMVEF